MVTLMYQLDRETIVDQPAHSSSVSEAVNAPDQTP